MVILIKDTKIVCKNCDFQSLKNTKRCPNCDSDDIEIVELSDVEKKELKQYHNNIIKFVAMIIIGIVIVVIAFVGNNYLGKLNDKEVEKITDSSGMQVSNIQDSSDEIQIHSKEWTNQYSKLTLNTDGSFVYSNLDGENFLQEQGKYAEFDGSAATNKAGVTKSQLFDTFFGENYNEEDGSSYIGSDLRGDVVVDKISNAEKSFDINNIAYLELTTEDTSFVDDNDAEITSLASADTHTYSEEYDDSVPEENDDGITYKFILYSYNNESGENHIALYDVNKQIYVTYECKE